MEVTKEQFQAYVTVQKTGMYNMFDHRARDAAGLSKETYMTILKEYEKLEDKYGTKLLFRNIRRSKRYEPR